MSDLKRSHLVACVSSLPPKKLQRVVGVRSSSSWSGDNESEINGVRYCIRQCNSPLAVREAIRSATDGAINIVVTNMDEESIGMDAMLRMASTRLLTIDRWQLVKDRFHARSIDPRITKHEWLADLLLEIPRVQPVAGGFLDAETVWPITLHSALGMNSDSLDLHNILSWSRNPEYADRWKRMPAEFKETATQWMSSTAGKTASLVLACVEKNESPDALPVGLVLDVLLNLEHKHEMSNHLIRLEERMLGVSNPSQEHLNQWAAASKDLVRFQMESSTSELKQVLSRADVILKELGADKMCFLSDVSPIGFHQRLTNFGVALSAQLGKGDFAISDGLKERYRRIFDHMKAPMEPLRLDRIKMAIRLLRWLGSQQQQTVSFDSLDQAIDYQLGEASFIDWARLKINTVEPSQELSAAFEMLFGKVADLRHAHAERFASLFQDSIRLNSNSDQFSGVETLLKDVVAPLAKDRPVLLVVLDGMSTAVFRELMQDIVHRDWYWLFREGRGKVDGALAAVPSETKRSRCSLLAGRFLIGNKEVEAREFPKHPELLRCCKPDLPPEIFHKSDIAPGDESDLSTNVRASIQDPNKQVVAVVVNAIDDHLAKSQQLETIWSRDAIKVLPLLLHEAKASERLVVIVSDHGHIIETGTEYKAHDGGGERWRPDDGAPGAEELRLEGQRVVTEGQPVIVPWSERIRYTRGKNNGYHGGINPQEIVFPVAVLSPTEEFPAGMTEYTLEDPVWWDEQYFHPPEIEGSNQPERELPAGLLFDIYGPDPDGQTDAPIKTELAEVPAVPGALDSMAEQRAEIQTPQWIKKLLESTLFESQMEHGRRNRLTPEKIRQVLVELERSGGKTTSNALARAVNQPPIRMRGFVSSIIRVLNIEAYEILRMDEASGTIELNKPLLLRQFEIEE